MAEQEVVKHSRRIYKIFKMRGKISHKVIEFIIEIIVIVFAISFSLFLERWREHQHDRHLEKEFLTDLRSDILIKMKELNGDYIAFNDITHKLNYLYKTGRQEIPFNKDSVRNYISQSLTSYYYLSPNNAIFESMKYSGKITVVEKKELRINIIKLYQEDLPFLQILYTEFYYPALRSLKQYAIENKVIKNKDNNLIELVMTQPELINLLENMDDAYKKIAYGYSRIIATNSKLLTQINEELK